MALPRLNPNDDTPLLADRLRALGYSEAAAAGLLGLWDLSQLDAGELPHYVWRCRRDGSDLAVVVLLFLLGEGISSDRGSKVLGREVLSSLLRSGVLFRRSGTLFSHVVVYPCLGSFLVTDYWVTQGQEEGQVYELGTDSYVLARLTPRRSEEKALDLCTGSGVHAVLSAKACHASTAVDINPRALEYTRFNAVLNSVEVEVHRSDLYQAVEGRRFDLITANPPYVPSPDREVLIHRSAGETGEEVPERLVAGLPERLAVGGLFSMVLEYPVLARESYLERLERWLGESSGWGIAVLSFGEKSVGTYIKKHMGPAEDYHATFASYLESYAEQGIEAIDFANVFIRREKAGRPNWKVKKKTFWPNIDLAGHMSDWLESQSLYLDPEWRPEGSWKPRLSRYYKKLWRDWDLTQGLLEATDDNWLPQDPLTADEAELMNMMRGQATVADLRRDWKGSEESFMAALRGLGSRYALV